MSTNVTKLRETKMVNIRIDPEVWQRGKAQAESEGMALNRWFERAVKHEIKRSAKLAKIEVKV